VTQHLPHPHAVEGIISKRLLVRQHHLLLLLLYIKRLLVRQHRVLLSLVPNQQIPHHHNNPMAQHLPHPHAVEGLIFRNLK
jgi:hypothetical protein